VPSGRFVQSIWLAEPRGAGSEWKPLASSTTARIETKMPDVPNPALEAETIRRMAREQVMLALSPAEVDALHTVLNSLLEEIRQIAPRDRADAEPEVRVAVEEWPA
jgi:hypothetical protein